MKALTTITLQSSHKRLRAGSIRSPAALPRMAIRGRAFLSEQANDNRSRYYKGGQSLSRRKRGRSVPAAWCRHGHVAALLCPTPAEITHSLSLYFHDAAPRILHSAHLWKNGAVTFTLARI